MRRKWRQVSLYVEWDGEESADALARMLVRKGVRGVEIDRDVDVESYPTPVFSHDHTVLRVCIDRDYPLFQLISDIAMCPGVFSVGEM